MKKSTEPLDRDFERDFSDVIDQLELPDLRLRSERRAVVCAAFEEARAATPRKVGLSHWAWVTGLAAAIVALGYLSYALLDWKPRAGATDTTAIIARSNTEHPALCEINVTLAVVNARTAEAERQLAWLSAQLADAGNAEAGSPLIHRP